MEQLADEMLLIIMQHLTVSDLFTLRRVCKRLGRLALHPSLWDRVHLFDDDRWLCPALRVAPSLKRLDVNVFSDDSLLPCGCTTAKTTRCAVAALKLGLGMSDELGEDSCALAAAVIRNQEALGRLKRLEVWLPMWDQEEEEDGEDSRRDGSGLMGTLATTSGLEALVLTGDLLPFRRPAVGSVPTPSLRYFSCSFDCSFDEDNTEDFYHFILTAHAATLEGAALDKVTSTSARMAPVLGRMQHLRHLECSLYPSMEVVADCATLIEVALNVDSDCGRPALRSAAEFLRRAKNQLRAVSLKYDAFKRPSTPGVDLVSALASPGQSQLQFLLIENGNSMKRTETFPQLQALLGALPALPSLLFLEVDAAPDGLMLGVTPNSAPALRIISLQLKVRCMHYWLHCEKAKTLLSANPSLELVGPYVDREYCPRGKLCKVCALGCHHDIGETLVEDKEDVVGEIVDQICTLFCEYDPPLMIYLWKHIPREILT